MLADAIRRSMYYGYIAHIRILVYVGTALSTSESLMKYDGWEYGNLQYVIICTRQAGLESIKWQMRLERVIGGIILVKLCISDSTYRDSILKSICFLDNGILYSSTASKAFPLYQDR